LGGESPELQLVAVKPIPTTTTTTAKRKALIVSLIGAAAGLAGSCIGVVAAD
jgi:hypothetical protein